jgi:hypothetical protein
LVSAFCALVVVAANTATTRATAHKTERRTEKCIRLILPPAMVQSKGAIMAR